MNESDDEDDWLSAGIGYSDRGGGSNIGGLGGGGGEYESEFEMHNMLPSGTSPAQGQRARAVSKSDRQKRLKDERGRMEDVARQRAEEESDARDRRERMQSDKADATRKAQEQKVLPREEEEEEEEGPDLSLLSSLSLSLSFFLSFSRSVRLELTRQLLLAVSLSHR